MAIEQDYIHFGACTPILVSSYPVVVEGRGAGKMVKVCDPILYTQVRDTLLARQLSSPPSEAGAEEGAEAGAEEEYPQDPPTAEQAKGRACLAKVTDELLGALREGDKVKGHRLVQNALICLGEPHIAGIYGRLLEKPDLPKQSIKEEWHD